MAMMSHLHWSTGIFPELEGSIHMHTSAKHVFARTFRYAYKQRYPPIMPGAGFVFVSAVPIFSSLLPYRNLSRSARVLLPVEWRPFHFA